MPSVQTYLAKYATEKLNEKFKVNITVDKVAITAFGGVKLKGVMVKDYHKDTLIYASRIKTNILDASQLLDGNLIFGTLDADSLRVKIVTYKGDNNNTLDHFISAFDDGKPSSGKFLMTVDKLEAKNSRFSVTDYNKPKPIDVDFTKLNTTLTAFKVKGPNVYSKINAMTFHDHRGLVVKSLTSDFTYTKQNIRLANLVTKTENSTYDGDVLLSYERKDFADFNNKVFFDFNTRNAKISSSDVKYFYSEMGRNQEFKFSGKLSGTLNDFRAQNFKLTDGHSIIDGDINFKNLFAKPKEGEFYMKGKFNRVVTSYDKLKALLPKLGNQIPTNAKKLGEFTIKGDAEVTPNKVNSQFEMFTKLGKVTGDLVIDNMKTNIDNADYSGTIGLEKFDLGTFINRKDFGKVTTTVDVEGKGFTQKYLNTTFAGDVKEFYYNGYNYKNILVDGHFKKPYFEGKLDINDPNLLMNFDGIVDLGKRANLYDFTADVGYANLEKLNFIKNETSIFKGKIHSKVSGTNLNNLTGTVLAQNVSYQNSKDTYQFEDLTLTSSFNAQNERNIVLSTPNTIKAKIDGKYDVNQIKSLFTNAVGSLYRNYKLDKVKRGQYIKFDFKEFNRLMEIIYPKVVFDQEATVFGNINGDDNDLKVNLQSKFIEGFNVHLDNVNLQVDNKNPLYNTYLEIDSIKTKYYKVRDFSMINTRSNDTLSFRTEFKGGNLGNDFYNLNLFHTINKDKKNVVGFNKSEMMFKNFLWYINEKEDTNNQIVFDNNFKDVHFNDITISHENQYVNLNGIINGLKEKDIKLTFHEVNLSKITPDVEEFVFEGNVNGDVYLKQSNAIYQPKANLTIDKLVLNDNELGNLALNIEGDNEFEKFLIDAGIENENFKSLNAQGAIEIKNNESVLDLDLDFKKFNLGILSKVAGDILSNVRGDVSGKAKIKGKINDLDYNGTLLVDNAGFGIPYLGVDYAFDNQTEVLVDKSSFTVSNTAVIDTKYKTKGNFSGVISHKKFGNWKLDLNVNSKNILALDTKDHEDAAFFGTAFMDGEVSIAGPTNALVIKVDAKSQKGTDIKIPINDATASEENNFIHFITKNEKYGISDSKDKTNKDYNGLQMFFDFKIDKNAKIGIILDRETGHGMEGVGDGDLTFRIDTKGTFNMWGDFVVAKGTYNFKYGGFLDKKFTVNKNGYISWSGDPYNASLNLEAVYNTSANPGILLDNTATVNQKTPVDVVISVKGTILNPEPDFNISFPQVSSVIRGEIENKLSDKDTRSKQALVLLSTGSFLSSEGLSFAQSTSFAYETASSILGNLFNDGSGKMNFGINYYQADRNALNPTDGRVVATLTTQLNDRITINGKVGVPVGGVTESTIVGNFEMQYRVNEDNTMRLRVFNRENDITYIGQGVGYTQGMGVYYEVDFDTFSELIQNIFKTKIKREKANSEKTEDATLPAGYNFTNEKEKKPATSEYQNNKEAVKKD